MRRSWGAWIPRGMAVSLARRLVGGSRRIYAGESTLFENSLQRWNPRLKPAILETRWFPRLKTRASTLGLKTGRVYRRAAMSSPAVIKQKNAPQPETISGRAKKRAFHPAPTRACRGSLGE